MKRRLIHLFFALFLISLSVLLYSCTLPSGASKHTVCVDINRDGFCDTCQAPVEVKKPECTTHLDENCDFICDKCGEELPYCTEHTDQNFDGKCDECNADVPLPECETHYDADTDGVCDRCGSEVAIPEPTEISLIEESQANFVFVVPSRQSAALAKTLTKLSSTLRALGYEIAQLEDNESTLSEEIEVLIGDIRSRGDEYSFDSHTLGAEGYCVDRIGNKIIVSGGSDAAIADAIDHFLEFGLKITDSTKKLTKATFVDKDAEIKVVQDNYKITSLTIGGVDISEHVIAVDYSDAENSKLAKSIQNSIYVYYGKWLEIIDITDISGENYIAVKYQSQDSGDGFEIIADGANLEIISAFSNKTLSEGELYFKTKLQIGRGDVILDSKSVNVRDVNYEMFGAAGDGETDDTEAMRACHEYANKYGHDVRLKENAQYYVGPMNEAIEIRTNVYFGSARIIIDDRNIPVTDSRRSVSIFKIAPTYSWFSLNESNSELVRAINAGGGLDKNTVKLDLGLGYDALIKVVNSNHKQFIRYGANKNSGSNMTDVISVDKDGNFDPNTPLLYDYETVTSIYIYRMDEKTITLSGGIFQQRANQADSSYTYYSRGIDIRRSNLVIKDLTYEITDERPGRYEGEPYVSFLRAENCANLSFLNCKLQAHRAYYSVGSGGSEVGMGSKVLSVTSTNNVLYYNCIQTNMFTDSTETTLTDGLWDIMSSNYSKNVKFEKCTLSRFDAHSGIYNADIIECKISSIRVVGEGVLRIENCEFWAPNSSNTFISTREDYGSFWKGSIIIKNIHMRTDSRGKVVNLITGHWYNHDFGYTVGLPEEIVIDNFTLDNPLIPIEVFSVGFVNELNTGLLPTVPNSSNEIVENINRVTPPNMTLTIKNNTAGCIFNLPEAKAGTYFENANFIIEE